MGGYIDDANFRPFVELEERVENLKWYKIYPEKLISNKPFDKESIDYLISQNWKVELNSFDSSCTCPGGGNRIRLKKSIKDYERDIHLFHEMIHAWYGYNLSDNGPGRGDNRTMVEHLARLKRSDSDLLNHSIFSFGLEPYIYDKISFEAFKDKKYFSDLLGKNLNLLDETLMDESDCLVYKEALSRDLEEKTIWKKIKSMEGAELRRTLDFLIEKDIMSYEINNNYSLCSEKNGETFGIEHGNSKIYFTNKEDASLWDKNTIPVKLVFN